MDHTDEHRTDAARVPIFTEEGVYGVILVAGMIVVGNSYYTTAWEVFVAVVATVVVFWAAHVYAGTVAHHGFEGGREVTLGQAFRISLRRALGLLVAALIPASILLLGATRVVPDGVAIWLAMWVGVAVLALIGYLAFRRRGSSVWICLLGSLTTAAFGLVMIVLKAAIH
ncbi:hypothetical protein EXU48_14815 [Occultella glacieicola]|uniref:Uncharacterized protein n=1 Tax=Occultella glacieicola TaxID=2518684 RepID=A0ABY2E2H7_9MICO|nr:hypothetical protein [Occultella glacieicola]TDE92781.1 hypothetical protein EXU48_14815 [Occultella glacieicola]